MPLQKFTMCHMPDFARVVRGILAMLRFFGVVRGTMIPLAPCRLVRITMLIPTYPSKAHIPQHP
jgi:hypothetical protein